LCSALLIALIVIIIIFTVNNKHKVDCSGDGFKSVTFNDSTGNEVYLKFMAFEKETQVYQLYSFPEAVDECEAKNATLWQVILGQEEWEAIIEPLKSKSRSGVWLHGRMEEDCSTEVNCCVEGVPKNMHGGLGGFDLF
jgi:hypothetical protein